MVQIDWPQSTYAACTSGEETAAVVRQITAADHKGRPTGRGNEHQADICDSKSNKNMFKIWAC